MKKIARWIYYNLLPIYIPKRYAYSGGWCFAVWCCIDCKRANRLGNIWKGLRITIRKDGEPVAVIKKGEV